MTTDQRLLKLGFGAFTLAYSWAFREHVHRRTRITCRMVSKVSSVVLCAATIATVHAAHAAPFTKKQVHELLAAQNRYRKEVGEPALVWSNKLADSAEAWARHLADEVHAIRHSGAAGTGENIATWTAGRASLTRLVGLWGAEKKYFVDASFPGVSRTGDWRMVAHYSQIVWRKTTEVGCGFATGGGQDYLVCQYDPMGNFSGERAF